jgi:AraC-like DNA-binding protein
MTPSKRAARERGLRRLSAIRTRIEAALAELERSGRYSDAARAGGYSDEFAFSRACWERLGARPRALMAMDWRAIVAERTAEWVRAQARAA